MNISIMLSSLSKSFSLIEQTYDEEELEEENEARYIIDILFGVIYGIETIVLCWMSFKILKYSANRTLMNWLTIMFMSATLISKIHYGIQFLF